MPSPAATPIRGQGCPCSGKPAKSDRIKPDQTTFMRVTPLSLGRAAVHAALTSLMAAKQRQKVAHGASRGKSAFRLKPQSGRNIQSGPSPTLPYPITPTCQPGGASLLPIPHSALRIPRLSGLSPGGRPQGPNYQTNPNFLEQQRFVFNCCKIIYIDL